MENAGREIDPVVCDTQTSTKTKVTKKRGATPEWVLERRARQARHEAAKLAVLRTIRQSKREAERQKLLEDTYRKLYG